MRGPPSLPCPLSALSSSTPEHACARATRRNRREAQPGPTAGQARPLAERGRGRVVSADCIAHKQQQATPPPWTQGPPSPPGTLHLPPLSLALRPAPTATISTALGGAESDLARRTWGDMHPWVVCYSSVRPEPTPNTSATRASAWPIHPFSRLRQHISRHPLQLRRNASSADNATPAIVDSDKP
jgi:hypothetical protein